MLLDIQNSFEGKEGVLSLFSACWQEQNFDPKKGERGEDLEISRFSGSFRLRDWLTFEFKENSELETNYLHHSRIYRVLHKSLLQSFPTLQSNRVFQFPQQYQHQFSAPLQIHVMCHSVLPDKYHFSEWHYWILEKLRNGMHSWLGFSHTDLLIQHKLRNLQLYQLFHSNELQ